MNSRDMQVIGICRFSYPALGGFQVEHDTIEDREAFLYDPIRMEERFRTFEALTLPPLRAQTDPDFTLAVVIGTSFPPHLRARLEALLADLPQAVLVAREPGRHRPVMKAVVNALREDRGLPSLQFRMDDDDAVSIRFVERLRETAQDMIGVIRNNRYAGIDFNQGFIARLDAGGVRARPCIETLWTPALAIAVSPHASRGIMNFSHAKLARIMPVLSVTGEDMFIRGHNDFNDSRQKDGIKPVRLPRISAEDAAHLSRVFCLDETRVRALYAA
ncbi:putative rhamnosyl transferase [Roseovarius sp. SCSIO 43702]|uniref:putative rhamnosyl transferase n=1 Tax=Roseovarius sp. SCSIO 43702 TaxID=2823043 RepID=UPI001C731754|nr:putative rhamnosyl transferase [Roseovarius sp. SCSIO 43702]QYX57741.1 putative rhamnosyl transferase [Roseovarius sp. SCSIO 43702]